MRNSDILRRLRYALNLDNAGMIRLFDLGGHAPSLAELDLLLKKDDDPACMDCPDRLLLAFLDGLVASRRGVRDAEAAGSETLDNTLVLRKLRIALKLKDSDMQRILAAGGMDVSRSELSALFRSPGHRNFVPCRDQLLRKFLAGLASISREDLQ
jgi:uncharacterized protein YehS (DUF1456 family)